jgi:fimbrial chaperone protein
MVVEFAPAGPKTTQTFLVENPTKEKIALQVEIANRKISEDGKEDYTQISPDFVIYPEQLSLEPGEKRNIRVTWVGNPKPEQELAYRMIASQLPVSLQKPTDRADVKVNLKFILQYVASIYVMPEGVRSDLKVVSAKSLSNGKLELIISNDGLSRQFLEKALVSFVGNGKTVALNNKQMEPIRSENILAKSRRKFIIPLPADLPKDFQAKIELH